MCNSYLIVAFFFSLPYCSNTFIAPSSTESLIFNGIPYDQLPIVNIKATYNNTHVSVAEHTGKSGCNKYPTGISILPVSQKKVTLNYLYLSTLHNTTVATKLKQNQIIKYL